MLRCILVCKVAFEVANDFIRIFNMYQGLEEQIHHDTNTTRFRATEKCSRYLVISCVQGNYVPPAIVSELKDAV